MKLLETPYVKVTQHGDRLTVLALNDIFSVSVMVDGEEPHGRTPVSAGAHPYVVSPKLGTSIVIEVTGPSGVFCHYEFFMPEYNVPNVDFPKVMEEVLETAWVAGRVKERAVWMNSEQNVDCSSEVEDANYEYREARAELAEWVKGPKT